MGNSELPGDRWALPGGFVGDTEDPAEAAARKLGEKTGLPAPPTSSSSRPLRGPIATRAAGSRPSPTSRSSLTEPEDPAARWIDARDHPPLALDHEQILATAIDRVRGKLWWSNVAVGVLPHQFTLARARGVYEAIAETTYDPATFARDLRATGLITRTAGSRRDTGGRPAALYDFTSRAPTWGAGHRKRVSIA